MKLPLFIIAILLLGGFFAKGQIQASKHAGERAASLKLDNFSISKLPAAYLGCGGSYQNAKQYKETSPTVIFYTTTGRAPEKEVAFISVSGKRIKLICQNDSAGKKTYKGQGYTAVLTITSGKKEAKGSSIENGVLDIWNGNHKLSIPVQGVSGC
jgi:hypothetical protein